MVPPPSGMPLWLMKNYKVPSRGVLTVHYKCIMTVCVLVPPCIQLVPLFYTLPLPLKNPESLMYMSKSCKYTAYNYIPAQVSGYMLTSVTLPDSLQSFLLKIVEQYIK